MAADRLTMATAPRNSRARVIADSPLTSTTLVDERLDSAECQLRVQFTRIAQLQAELDVMSAVFRRWMSAPSTGLDDRGPCVRDAAERSSGPRCAESSKTAHPQH